MKGREGLLKAYHEFRNSVDFTRGGILPELHSLVWCMLMGIPRVPADEETSSEAQVRAIDQRVAILKVVFVEVNRGQAEDFLDQGLGRFDEAGKTAKNLLEEMDAGAEEV
jgi:hypothetical protein